MVRQLVVSSLLAFKLLSSDGGASLAYISKCQVIDDRNPDGEVMERLLPSLSCDGRKVIAAE